MKRIKKLVALIACLVMTAAMLPMHVLAAGAIDPTRDVSLTISYKNGEKPLAGAKFDVYCYADVDPYAQLSVRSAFAEYPIDPQKMDQEKWMDLASTLKGYVQRDSVQADTVIEIGANGSGVQTVKPGLYLVVGRPYTTDDAASYHCLPFMLFLPAENKTDNSWSYSVVVQPKHDFDAATSRKVVKVWDDTGFERERPAEVIVQLLKNGVAVQTVALNRSNNWMYTWENLDASCDWTVVEKEVGNYYTTVTKEGTLFTVTNKYIVPYTVTEPLAVKKISGDSPRNDSQFTFVLAADEDGYPMPAGATGSYKKITIRGEGDKGFGRITFTEPGRYSYTIWEENTHVEGYRYDREEYHLVYDVFVDNGELRVKRIFTNSADEDVDAAVFVNKYTHPGKKLPQTGVMWWPVPLLLACGIAFCIIGSVKKKMEE